MGDWEEGVLFTCFFVLTAYRLAPSGETSEIVIEYSEAFTFPLLAGFQNGKIVQLFVIDAEEIVNAPFCAVFLAELLAECSKRLTLC